VILPGDPLDVTGLDLGTHRFTERRAEGLLAASLPLVFDRILALGKAQLDTCRVQGIVEIADDVGGVRRRP
jgi:hypothetical protein